MTAIHPDSSATLTTYTGDPQQVFRDAIAAKVEGHLTDAQFDALIEASRSTIPTQTVTAHPVHDAPTPMSRTQLLLAWLSQRPVVGTLLVAIVLMLAIVTGWAGVAFVIAAANWLSLHIVSVGIAAFITFIMSLIFMALRNSGRRAHADLYRARYGQQPVHVHVEDR